MELMDSSFFYGGKIDKKGRRLGYLMQVFKLDDGKFRGQIAKAAELWVKGNMADFEIVKNQMVVGSWRQEHIQDARNWAYRHSEHRIKRWKKTHPEQ